jgi:redox-sensitive bicupin YhaK (pirin superfamily)
MGERRAERLLRGMPTSDGAGVALTRVIGQPALPQLDPFLLLDEFRADDPGAYIAGFPDHPHRGFETVTYMLAGRMRHRDNHGAEGELKPGGAQWMTAGRGLVHSEMPLQDSGLMWGFQLWVNLPAREKMTAPRYQDIEPEAIPEAALDGARIRVVAGRLEDGSGGSVTGPVAGLVTDPLYLDVALDPGARLALPAPAGHSAFAYVFEGAANVGGESVPRGSLAILGDGDRVRLAAEGGAARLLLVAARPLGEPVARYGPFVMNTAEEIHEAFRDFEAGRF